ncbi:hypothetical protein PUNSTDRAFT_142133 [Punctularia strigosozonata HHB-11173 SS5]|uniref:uncharacterized protein n=1 Tax=Punctularia strigosozonata (strain HHB-11173) TaxID=741275 RepID=UPI0004417C5D|nr:uncharacterized protein PUNSTDRAFT_142133 [Punctularia strigosozonata HHB-11173 SS5]EIN11925.1 hypothetical protein PUNSTDRAFT_142133 [Punctularia strigosozonata HHB-11173 SS5]
MSQRPTSLFAFIVGINQYHNHELGNLNSAVSDAEDLKGYLEEHLLVPEHNIRLMRDLEATHDGIIQSFREHLTFNPHIRRGDPILIYYAGHGSRYPAGGSWPTDDGFHEAICPCDRGVVKIDGSVQQDIADLTLGGLLLELSETKGDNITVVMDCCHSGSGTRAGGSSSSSSRMRPRFATPLTHETAIIRMREEAFDFIRPQVQTRRVEPVKMRYPDSRTHVLLAACRQDEQAWESDEGGSGLFTSALLHVLRSADLPRLSYMTLMAEIGKLPYQTPQCEGKHRNRIIFDGKALGIDKKLVPVRRSGDGGLRVEAGEIHGVIPGTEFAVRSHNFYSAENSHLGYVVAVDVFAVYSIVQPRESSVTVPPNSYATVSYWANVDDPFVVSFFPPPPNDTRQRLLEDEFERFAQGDRSNSDIHFERDDMNDDANLIVFVDEEEMVIERRHPLITEYCLVDWTWKRKGDRQELDILKMIARFEMHLDRQNPDQPFQKDVSMGLVRLGSDSQPTRGNHISGGVADLPDDPNAQYAVVLHNSSNTDLWCSLYYFDPSEYAITDLYVPPSSTMHPPLRRHSDLTLGYGSTVVTPFSLTLKPEDERDTGFLKLFISEQYADLSLMEQNASYDYMEPETTRGGTLPQGHGRWDTILTIINVSRNLE